MLAKNISFHDIAAAVTNFYQIDSRALCAKSPAKKVSRPRFVAIHLARVHTSLSYPDLARRLHKKDHTTILHADRRAAQLIASDPTFAGDVAAIGEILAHTTPVRRRIAESVSVTVAQIDRAAIAATWV